MIKIITATIQTALVLCLVFGFFYVCGNYPTEVGAGVLLILLLFFVHTLWEGFYRGWWL